MALGMNYPRNRALTNEQLIRAGVVAILLGLALWWVGLL